MSTETNRNMKNILSKLIRDCTYNSCEDKCYNNFNWYAYTTWYNKSFAYTKGEWLLIVFLFIVCIYLLLPDN